MIIFHLLVFYLLVVAPIWGYISYRNFIREVAVDPSIRTYYYKMWILELWLLSAAFVAAAWWRGLTWEELGFVPIEFNSYSYGLFTGVFIAIIVPVILYRYISSFRSRTDKQFDHIKEFLPVTPQERWFWVLLSLTAGICEELLFRAFLFNYIPEILPNISIWLIVIISCIIFGLGHTYQGVKGVLSTALMGVIFAKIYLLTNSIILCMVIHFLIDLRILLMLPENGEKTRVKRQEQRR